MIRRALAPFVVAAALPGSVPAQCLVAKFPSDAVQVEIHDTPAGYRLATTDSTGVHVYDVATGQEVFFLPYWGWHLPPFKDVTLDEQFVVIGHPFEDINLDGVALVYDHFTGQLVNTYEGTGGFCSWYARDVSLRGGALLVSEHDPDQPDGGGRAFYYAGLSGTGETARLENPEATGKFGSGVSIGTSEIGDIGAVGHWNYYADQTKVYVYELSTTPVLIGTYANVTDSSYGHDFALDDGVLAVSSRSRIYLYDTTTGEPIAVLAQTEPKTLFLSGGMLAASGPGGIALHDASTGTLVRRILPPPGTVSVWDAVSLNGERLAVTATIDGQDWILVYSVPRATNDADGNGWDDACEWREGPTAGHWYNTIPAARWPRAEEQASAFGGHLATVGDQAENDWITAHLAPSAPVWIGYTDQASEGLFEWISAEPSGYENWQPGQPDDASDSDWTLLSAGVGTWSDEPLASEHAGVVEVVSPDCDGNGIPDVTEIALDPRRDFDQDGVLDVCGAVNYCVATPNSSGAPAVASVSGNLAIPVNGFILHASQLPANEVGYFIASRQTGFVPLFGGGAGNLCLGPPIVRFNLPPAGGVLFSGPAGAFTFQPNLTLLPPGTVFVPGETWHFQAWFRDGPTSNTTDGVRVTFL